MSVFLISFDDAIAIAKRLKIKRHREKFTWSYELIETGRSQWDPVLMTLYPECFTGYDKHPKFYRNYDISRLDICVLKVYREPA